MKSKKWSAVTLLAGLFSVVGCVLPPGPKVCRASDVAILDDGPPRTFDFRGFYRARGEFSLQISETTYTLCQGSIIKNKNGYNVKDRVCEHGDVVWKEFRGSSHRVSAYLVGFGDTKTGAKIYDRYGSGAPHWSFLDNRNLSEDEKFDDGDYRLIVNGMQPLCSFGTCATFGPMDTRMLIWHLQDLECLGEWADVLFEQEE